MLLFQPETTEEQFRFYLQIVDGRLEDYKECFDWLLSAEEFHRESDWLECMRNHAVEISDVEHAIKMIDIIYMQRQCLCADDKSSDTVYRDMKQVNYMFRGFIKVQAPGKLTGCERDLATNLPGCFHLLFLRSFIRRTKSAQLKNFTDLLHKNLMKPLLYSVCTL